jgi:ABC-type cobalamin transport system ATPase subunit
VLLLQGGRAIAQGPRDAVLTPENLSRAFLTPFERRGGRFEVRSAVLPAGTGS